MTVHLDWPDEVVTRLSEEARQRGLSLEVYLLEMILERMGRDERLSDDERRQAREEAARSIRDLRKGNVLGPELNIRDLIEEGRRF